MNKIRITEIPIPCMQKADGYPLSSAEYVVEIFTDGFVVREKRGVFGPFISWKDLTKILKIAFLEGLYSEEAINLFDSLSEKKV